MALGIDLKPIIQGLDKLAKAIDRHARAQEEANRIARVQMGSRA